MKKRNLLTIILIASTTFASIVILLIQINIFLMEAINKDILGEEIIKNVFELGIIINDHDVFHKERSHQQFKIKHDKLLKLFDDANKTYPEDRNLFENMAKSQLTIDYLMGKKVKLLDKYQNNAKKFKNINERYSGQMNIHAHNIVSNAFSITTKYQRQIYELRYKANWYIVFLIIIISSGVGMALFLYFTIIEKKHSEEILKQSNEQLEIKVKERTEELKKIIVEKETLMKEIHHRVKNNLGIIQGLLSLQSIDASRETKDLLSVSEDRVKSMSLIHEMLYKSEDLKSINLLQYINSLSTILFQNYTDSSKKIEFKLDIADLQIDINIVIPLGLILNEAITNSLKYAFPTIEVGEIYISLKKIDDGNIVLKIKDNGIGIQENINFHEPITLGIKLIKILSDQIDADLKLNRDNGTEFILIFEDKKY